MQVYVALRRSDHFVHEVVGEGEAHVVTLDASQLAKRVRNDAFCRDSITQSSGQCVVAY